MSNFRGNWIYNDGFEGYDGLLTFLDVFPDYNTFKELLSKYMWFESLEEDEVLSNKLYTQLLNRYRQNYFRYKQVSTICTKLASLIEEFLRYNGMVNKLVKDIKPGDIETISNYKTNNTNNDSDTANLIKYRTAIEETVNVDWKAMTEQQLGSVLKVKGYEAIISKIGLKMMMNRQKQVNNLDLFNRGDK